MAISVGLLVNLVPYRNVCKKDGAVRCQNIGGKILLGRMLPCFHCISAVRASSSTLHAGGGGGSEWRGWVWLGDVITTAAGNDWAKNTTMNYGKKKATKEVL
jgi:hypothetical protein